VGKGAREHECAQSDKLDCVRRAHAEKENARRPLPEITAAIIMAREIIEPRGHGATRLAHPSPFRL
jgi:hypothetical protein